MSKESVYDAEIDPLVVQIIAICQREKIAMIADFHLGDNLKCTTALLDDESDPTTSQLQALRLLGPRGGKETTL